MAEAFKWLLPGAVKKEKKNDNKETKKTTKNQTEHQKGNKKVQQRSDIQPFFSLHSGLYTTHLYGCHSCLVIAKGELTNSHIATYFTCSARHSLTQATQQQQKKT